MRVPRAAPAALEERNRRPNLVLHVVGIVLAVGGAGMLVAAAVDAVDGGPDVAALAWTGITTLVLGAGMWRATSVPAQVRLVHIFAVVTSAWLALSVAAAVPYLATGSLDRIDNALFEAVAGLTTTGSTVMRPIEGNSAGILFWRAITQWLGGMGVIVLVVAVLPVVGGGGMSLLEAEAPGPAGERLAPRVRDTARHLWRLYLGLTLALVGGYFVAGMSIYDAVAHSFTTVSTGGFSPYNASIAHFDSVAIEWVAIVGMFLAGGSFALYYRVLRGSTGPLLQSAEFRVYVLIVTVATGMAMIAASDVTGAGHTAFRDALFSVVSVVTTTGYATADFGAWAESAQVMLLLLMPIGAMAGSTAGGVKIVRLLVATSLARRELQRQLHPRLVRAVRVGREPVDESIAQRTVGFLIIATVIMALGAVVVAMAGAELRTALSASLTTFANVGPGLGEIGPTADFLAVDPPARWMGMANMLLGRLEIFPVLLALAALPRIRRPALFR